MKNESFEKWFDDHQASPFYGEMSWYESVKLAWEARDARIAELTADCKAMAEALLESHTGTNMKAARMREVRKGLVEYYCTCPACIIAAKYQEGA